TRVSPNRLELAEFNRWAEPLERSFSRVLVDNLCILLATEQITLHGRENPTPPDFQILLSVTRFDGTLGGNASLVARWSITGIDGTVVTAMTKSTINVPTSAAGYEALAAALSQTIAELSREIAAAIKAHPTS
ncbi:MAG: membrane integrity-associated transporter subunit PqiC, partial [Planctomycetes bacterium]|nr:membrane integrity-associated transporter subunit PqiC [Planctomycetota bacterium]